MRSIRGKRNRRCAWWRRVLPLLAACCLWPTAATAQGFFNLTAQEVKIDSTLPRFAHAVELGSAFADSVYTVSIDYPEFIDMAEADVARYRAITADVPPSMPTVDQYVGVSRKRGTLYLSFVPVVYREGRFQKLVSFKLTVKATAARTARGPHRAAGTDRYAAHSVLATGQWAKIRVPATGVYQLTDALLRQAGFSDPSRVKVYGYGGAWQPERLTGDYLAATDDLAEVPTCTVGGRRLFYAVGPVGWESATATLRTRNPYSSYGYYFLTEGDDQPAAVDSASFVASFYPSPTDYHSLYEDDSYAWFHGGRNLYDGTALNSANQQTSHTLAAYSSGGTLAVAMSYGGYCQADVYLNDELLGSLTVNEATVQAYQTKGVDSYSAAAVNVWTFRVDGSLRAENTVTLRHVSGADMRLDYLCLTSTEPRPLDGLTTATLPTPEYVCRITNQDHHADPQADMVIVIPTTQRLLAQAERLKQLHEEHDAMRVNVVPADELYNEFSSGTPDANAYRRYLKMLYDRAETDADLPSYLLLLGDGAWDNRMLTSNWRGYSPDDFLLCYESDNSFSETECYVSDDYFCLLDDGEGGNMLSSDRPDVAVGRLPARNEAEAKVMVDKTVAYVANEQAGAWQNTICFMGDDGNNNLHMVDADTVAIRVEREHPALNVKRIYWDAYQLTQSATGNSYPDVTRLVKQQMQNGALVMDYCGHGAAYCISHEQVVKLADFAEPASGRLPLWITASCDIMPFDGQTENIGETAMLNKQGGAVAFYGTTRTVYASYNLPMNKAYMGYVLGSTNGVRNSIGEAARLAKSYLVTTTTGGDRTANKLQYTLLGDPALVLALPTLQLAVDSVNGQPASAAGLRLCAGQTVTVKGHVVDQPDFDGVVTATVRDVEQTVVCKMNPSSAAQYAFTFKDRPGTLYNGSDSVRRGAFSITFAVPRDIDYADANGLINLYAVSSDKKREANGRFDNFTLGAADQTATDGVGPSIYCYLNSSSFTNGDKVNSTPYFYAELTDKDGINASGNGIGHDLELVIDGKMTQTYVLNDYFQYDFFRAWDVLNNSSTAELTFTVAEGLEPTLRSVSCTKNPATTSTTFLITHDRMGSQLDVRLEIFDTSGRQLYSHAESGASQGNTYTLDWDLTVDGGSRLQTGVYLYRVLISSEGGTWASKANKLIVLRNK